MKENTHIQTIFQFTILPLEAQFLKFPYKILCHSFLMGSQQKAQKGALFALLLFLSLFFSPFPCFLFQIFFWLHGAHLINLLSDSLCWSVILSTTSESWHQVLCLTGQIFVPEIKLVFFVFFLHMQTLLQLNSKELFVVVLLKRMTFFFLAYIMCTHWEYYRRRYSWIILPFNHSDLLHSHSDFTRCNISDTTMEERPFISCIWAEPICFC